MDLSRRYAFRPCSRDSSADKGKFGFNNKKKVIGIGPPYRFYMSFSAVLLLNLQLYQSSLPSTQCLLQTFKIYHNS